MRHRGEVVAAEVVVDEADADALLCFADEEVVEFVAYVVVFDDVEFDVYAVLGLLYVGEYGVEGCHACGEDFDFVVGVEW